MAGFVLLNHPCTIVAAMILVSPLAFGAIRRMPMDGMTPMSPGVGEGSEPSARPARAVTGGLPFAAFATLIFVPAMYRLSLGRSARPQPLAGGAPVLAGAGGTPFHEAGGAPAGME